jgi:glycine cleavage system transcriptional repressor
VRHLALSAIGRDRPGIVAAITGVLLEHRANIEDSQMTILRGHFAMMLVVSIPDGGDARALEAELREEAERLGLEALSLRDVADVEQTAPEPSHIVSIYGVDHPGIVHAAALALAAQEVNITDLNTRLVEEADEEPLYALMMEVALPRGGSAAALTEALEGVGRREGVEVTVRELEGDAL